MNSASIFFFQFSLNILKFLVHCDGPKYSKGLPAKPVLPHRLLLSVAAQCVPDEVCLMKESNFTITGVCFCNLGGAGLFLQSLRNYFQESNVLSDVISVCVCLFVAYTNLLIKHIVELSHSCGNRKQVNTVLRLFLVKRNGLLSISELSDLLKVLLDFYAKYEASST